MYELPHDLPNDFRLRILRNKEIPRNSLKCLDLMGSTQPACFYVTITGNFKRFQYFNFEKNFWKMEAFFKKLEYSFLVESARIESACFHTKVTCQYPMLRQIERTKWTYQKGRCFASNYFIFWKFYFSLRTSCKELIWCTNDPNVHIHPCREQWNFIFESASPLWASLNNINFNYRNYLIKLLNSKFDLSNFVITTASFHIPLETQKKFIMGRTLAGTCFDICKLIVKPLRHS